MMGVVMTWSREAGAGKGEGSVRYQGEGTQRSLSTDVSCRSGVAHHHSLGHGFLHGLS